MVSPDRILLARSICSDTLRQSLKLITYYYIAISFQISAGISPMFQPGAGHRAYLHHLMAAQKGV